MSKPEPTARSSHPNTTNPRWIAGKATFADLLAGGSVERLSTGHLRDACFYSSTLMFPPAGGGKVKAALRDEAKKRNVLP